MSKRPFGFVRVRHGRRSPYVAGFNPPLGGPEITRAFATEAEAEVWLAEQYVDIAKGRFIDPTGGKATLGAYWDPWFRGRVLRETSRSTYAAHWRRHIAPVFGERPLASIRRSEIQAWVNRLPVKPTTAKTVLAILQSVLASAVEDDLLAKSPAHKVRPPKAPGRHLVIPEAEAVEAIAAAITPRYRIAVLLAAEAGLRLGEVCGLRLFDVNTLRAELTVRRQAQTIGGRGVVLDLDPKSEAGFRTIPLAPETSADLAQHVRDYPSPHGLVLTTSYLTPVRRNVFNEAWNKAKSRAGLDGPPLRFHDLRHRYASVLIAEGIDAKSIQTYLGHVSITETYDTYGHLLHAQPERARAAITRSMRRATDQATDQTA
jgi:integrase